MKARIVCTVCSEVMGTVDKPVIDQDDIDSAPTVFTCSAGHQACGELQVIPEE